MTTPLKLARWLALSVPLLALAGALAFQFWGGLYPCEMCWWQRYGHIAALALALLSFALPARRWPVALSALALGVAGLIGLYHAGVEYGWWQGLTACTSTVHFKGGDPVAEILAAPLVRCDVVQWELFGLSLAGYNFLMSTAGAGVILALLSRAGGKAKG